MSIAWNDDPPGPGSQAQIAINVAAVLGRIAGDARARRTPTIAMAQDWHRQIYREIELPVAYYAGGIRDSDPNLPELYGYEVSVGGYAGVSSTSVPAELERFEQTAQHATRTLDSVIPLATQPADNHQLLGVLELCAALHGEWVRIHPFANGNGRTARMWANWAALRYGLPPFVAIKPRPQGIAYAAAAFASMRREHQVMTGVFLRMLQERLAP
jgi:fido (protein-threonine AMPylation protein)